MREMVIAGSPHEAAEFRAQEDLPPSSIARSRDRLLGARPLKVHILPEFHRRRDIPAWRAQLRTMLRRSPKTQILIWEYGEAGFVHVRDARLDNLARFVFLDAGTTVPEPLKREPANPTTEEPTGEPVEDKPPAATGVPKGVPAPESSDADGDANAPVEPEASDGAPKTKKSSKKAAPVVDDSNPFEDA